MSGLLRNFSLIGKTHRTEYRVSGFWTDIPSCFQLDVPTRKDYGFEKKRVYIGEVRSQVW
jgi:hypothetical protein